MKWIKCLPEHEQAALMWLAFHANREGIVNDFKAFDMAEDCGMCAAEADAALEALDARGILVFSRKGKWAVVEPWALED